MAFARVRPRTLGTTHLAVTGAGAGAVRVTETLALSLAGLVSSARLETLAVFVTVPKPAVTLIVTPALAPLGRTPSAQVSAVVPVQPGAETSFVPAGSESDSTTPLARSGPLFFTPIE